MNSDISDGTVLLSSVFFFFANFKLMVDVALRIFTSLL